MDDRVRSKSARGWLISLALLAALALVVLWQVASKMRVPDPHRVEMYQRTLETVRSSCAEPKPAVKSYCRDQAALLLEFPECDAECVALARRVRGEPTR
jgi:hypothetical protein